MKLDKKNTTELPEIGADAAKPYAAPAEEEMLVERNGPKGPEPTRYGDWEQKGRCSDF